jgi:hypothetical protein
MLPFVEINDAQFSEGIVIFAGGHHLMISLGVPLRRLSTTQPVSWNRRTSWYSVFLHGARILGKLRRHHTSLKRVTLKVCFQQRDSVTATETHSRLTAFPLASPRLLTGRAIYTGFWNVLPGCQHAKAQSMAAKGLHYLNDKMSASEYETFRTQCINLKRNCSHSLNNTHLTSYS